ncbi:MAG: NAD-dependent protein deacetylase [Rhodoferax sp.]
MDTFDPLLNFVALYPRLLVLTGAGCSTEAGIPDYRDVHGAWKRSEPMRFQVFVADALARKRYWARSMVGWRTIRAAQPTTAHRALVRLEQAGRMEMLVTQNVDGLHNTAGSTQVIDLHGRMDTVCCLGCGVRSPRQALQDDLQAHNPNWLQGNARSAPDGDADLDAQDFNGFVVPPCPQCGGVLKPDVVFFGESVPLSRVATVRSALARADALLVVGSSLMVYSGYRFVEDAVAAGKPVAVVNLGRTRADALLTLKVEQEVGAALDRLAAQLEAPPLM